jgi:hypothetical protein
LTIARIRDIRQLLATAEHPIQPAQHRLATLDDLTALAADAGIDASAPTRAKPAS